MRLGSALLRTAALVPVRGASSQPAPSLVGTWRLVSFESRYGNRNVKYLLGRGAVGQLT